MLWKVSWSFLGDWTFVRQASLRHCSRPWLRQRCVCRRVKLRRNTTVSLRASHVFRRFISRGNRRTLLACVTLLCNVFKPFGIFLLRILRYLHVFMERHVMTSLYSCVHQLNSFCIRCNAGLVKQSPIDVSMTERWNTRRLTKRHSCRRHAV